MVNIDDVIFRVDAVKANTFDRREKARWLMEVEGKIYREVLRCDGEIPVYSEGNNISLTAEPPYDALYDYYLFAMIDFHNREGENYYNSYAMFNEKFNDFAKYLQRTHRPPNSGGFDTMGYF